MTRKEPPFDRRALTDGQRYLAEDIASSMPDRHDESCGVWSEDGDGCDCPLVMAVADGLDASRVVAVEVERGYDSTTRRGDRVVRLPFRPMPDEAEASRPPASGDALRLLIDRHGFQADHLHRNKEGGFHDADSWESCPSLICANARHDIQGALTAASGDARLDEDMVDEAMLATALEGALAAFDARIGWDGPYDHGDPPTADQLAHSIWARLPTRATPPEAAQDRPAEPGLREVLDIDQLQQDGGQE